MLAEVTPFTSACFGGKSSGGYCRCAACAPAPLRARALSVRRRAHSHTCARERFHRSVTTGQHDAQRWKGRRLHARLFVYSRALQWLFRLRVFCPVPMPGIFGGPASGSQGTKRCSHEEGCGREALPLCAGASGCYSCHATGDAQRVDDVACGALPSCGLCPQPQVKPLDGR